MAEQHKQLCGGTTAEKDVTPDVHEIALKVKGEAEVKTNRVFNEWTAKKFKTQVVAGTNYFIKIHVGNDEYLHLRVFRSLSGDATLHSLQEHKDAESEISYF